MEKFLKLALLAVVGIIVGSFTIGLVSGTGIGSKLDQVGTLFNPNSPQVNSNSFNTRTEYGPQGYGPQNPAMQQHMQSMQQNPNMQMNMQTQMPAMNWQGSMNWQGNMPGMNMQDSAMNGMKMGTDMMNQGMDMMNKWMPMGMMGMPMM